VIITKRKSGCAILAVLIFEGKTTRGYAKLTMRFPEMLEDGAVLIGNACTNLSS
jgi:hypothetical protein